MLQPDEAADLIIIIRQRAPDDHVAPDGWWAFTTVLVDGRLAWLRRPGGPRRPEATPAKALGPW